MKHQMKKAIYIFVPLMAILFSCHKEISCENCRTNPGNTNKPPTARAGPDQVITLPTDSISLDGSASNDPDGTISEWLWKKISGPASFTIKNAAVSKTIVKNLSKGIYHFELKVKDDKGATAIDTVQISVNDPVQPNRPPVADAGADQTISLPTNTVSLNGSASTDPDNNITAYQWAKISNSSSFTISNINAVQTQVTNLIEGVYQFELMVTDAGGLMAKDTVQVTVNPETSPPQPCTTNCGKIVFVSDRDGNNEIYSCNADGSDVTCLTNDPGADEQPVWSPDGNSIAFIKNAGSYGEGDLYIMNANGSNIVQRTFLRDVKNPAWSPDGTRIAFTDMIDQTTNSWTPVIKVIELSSGLVSTLPNTMGSSLQPHPAWSPDGTKIAFDSDWNAWDFISDIFVITPNGNGFTLLTNTFLNDYDYWKPAWSPNGTKLSVTIHQMNSLYNQDGSIGIMNADGSGLTIIKTGITMALWNETRTSWSPGGTRLAYTENKIIKWVAANGSGSGTIIANAWDADWKH